MASMQSRPFHKLELMGDEQQIPTLGAGRRKLLNSTFVQREIESTKNYKKPPKLQVWVSVIAKLQSSDFIRHTPTLLPQLPRPSSN